MTIAQFIVAYSVCWWLVLFMVLPHGVAAEQNPQTGNAPSAPANPRLKRKFFITTLIAFIPTLVIYLVASNAQAEDSIYHASSKCKSITHTPKDDVKAVDGHGIDEKTMKPATINGYHTAFDEIDMPLEIPNDKYLNQPNTNRNVDLSKSHLQVGTVSVKQNGNVLLNGQPIINNNDNSDGCADE